MSADSPVPVVTPRSTRRRVLLGLLLVLLPALLLPPAAGAIRDAVAPPTAATAALPQQDVAPTAGDLAFRLERGPESDPECRDHSRGADDPPQSLPRQRRGVDDERGERDEDDERQVEQSIAHGKAKAGEDPPLGKAVPQAGWGTPNGSCRACSRVDAHVCRSLRAAGACEAGIKALRRTPGQRPRRPQSARFERISSRQRLARW